MFPFYNPDTINLHVLMVLSIGGIANAMLLPPQSAVLPKSARFQMEINIFSGLVAGLKDSFHMLIYRLTNEAFFDIGICENCKLGG